MNRFINALVNEQQLLQLALYAANEFNDENHPLRMIADGIIVGYVLGQFEAEGLAEFSDEDIQEEYAKLVTGFTLTKMVSDGTLEVELSEEGEFVYTLSEKGKQIAEKIKRDYD